MPFVLALASAALYGAADFLGGLAARRASTIAVVLVSQAAGLLPLALFLVLVPASPAGADFVWGGLAGLAGSVGVALLYRALAIGTMSIVAPTTAVCAVMLPVLVEALRGDRPGTQTTAGIALALVAIVLVSQHDGHGAAVERRAAAAAGRPRALPPGLALALLSGVAIGLFFLTLAETAAAAGLWPLLAARGVSIAAFGGVALAGAVPLRMVPGGLPLALACGVMDMVANVLYLLASRGGPLSVVVTLASLYPASTVVLARVVMGERLTPRQSVGILCAIVAVVAIVGGESR